MKAMYLIAGNDASPFHMQTYLKTRRGVPAGCCYGSVASWIFSAICSLTKAATSVLFRGAYSS